MRRVLRILTLADNQLARVEAFLLCVLVFGLIAGGMALVLLQNTGPEARPGILVAVRAIGIVLVVVGTGMWATGLGGPARRRALEGWGLKVLALGALTLMTWGMTHLEGDVETVQRRAVLWIALIAGSLATRQRKHIAIEALEKFLKGGVRRAATGFVAAGSFAMVVYLALASGRYAFDPAGRQEAFLTFYESGVVVREWWIKLILPIGFTLIAWRLFLFLLESLAGEAKPAHETPLPELEHVHDEASWAEESQS